MNEFSRCGRSRAVLLAAAAAVALPVSRAVAGTTGSATTISTAGSTALKNWFVKNTTTFTDVTPGTQVDIGGVEYPSSLNEWAPQYGGTGTALAFQLAPKSYNGGQEVTSAEAPGTIVDQASAVRFEYHESGSVEGRPRPPCTPAGPASVP
jgi:ABC-type phosphate transport system substrate-binding protein